MCALYKDSKETLVEQDHADAQKKKAPAPAAPAKNAKSAAPSEVKHEDVPPPPKVKNHVTGEIGRGYFKFGTLLEEVKQLSVDSPLQNIYTMVDVPSMKLHAKIRVDKFGAAQAAAEKKAQEAAAIAAAVPANKHANKH